MRQITTSVQRVLKLLAMCFVIGALCALILSSSLTTPIALALIAALLILTAVGLRGSSKSAPALQDNPISDPIFVNETWILKR